jgi:hypothetical protein
MKAAVIEGWVQRYNQVTSNGSERLSSIVSDASGDIIVAGSIGAAGSLTDSPDMLIVKYSGANGSLIWQKRYNGAANSIDESAAIALDADGNVAMTGYSYSSTGSSGLLHRETFGSKRRAPLGETLQRARSGRPAIVGAAV